MPRIITTPADPYYPAGAIENGRESLRRLVEHYKFTDEEGHLLSMVIEWACLEQAFEYMAIYLAARYDSAGSMESQRFHLPGTGRIQGDEVKSSPESQPDAEYPLDKIWYEINALGGLPSTPHDEGYCKAIGHALAIIEEHGGVDPLSRRRDNGPFGVGA